MSFRTVERLETFEMHLILNTFVNHSFAQAWPNGDNCATDHECLCRSSTQCPAPMTGQTSTAFPSA
jgi:hypothetical protein